MSKLLIGLAVGLFVGFGVACLRLPYPEFPAWVSTNADGTERTITCYGDSQITVAAWVAKELLK